MEERLRRRSWRLGRILIGTATLLCLAATPVVQARTQSAPKAGGSIAYQLGNNPDCLDPQKTAQSAAYGVFEWVADPLLSEDTKGKIRGNLATSWKVSNGGKTLTFNLRHGVRFSNGDPFNANAVKYTFERALNPATKSPATASDLSALQSVKVINQYTVRLILKVPNRPLLTNLTIPYTGILDPKATQAEGNGTCQNPVGTGPYKVSSVVPGFAGVTEVRNKYHNWNPSWMHNQGTAYLSSINFKPISVDATAVSELLAGQLDIATVDGTQIGRVKGNKSIKLKNIATQGEDYLGFNTAHAPFNNPAVRRAVAQLINRNDVIKVALNGLGKPAYSPVPSTLPYYDKNAATYDPKYDPSAAQKVFAANHLTGPYTLLVPQGSELQAAAELIQGEFAQAGVKVTVDVKALSDYIPAAAKGDFDMNLIGWGWPDPDFLYSLFHSSQGKGAGLNWTNYVNPTLDSLLTQQRTTLNAKKAAAIFAQLQKLMDTQAVIVPLYIPTSPIGFRSRVKGVNINRAGFLSASDLFVLGT